MHNPLKDLVPKTEEKDRSETKASDIFRMFKDECVICLHKANSIIFQFLGFYVSVKHSFFLKPNQETVIIEASMCSPSYEIQRHKR